MMLQRATAVVASRRILVAVLVLALACDARKKRVASPQRKAGCEDVKTASQLIKRARKLQAGGRPDAALGCLEVGSRRFEEVGEVWEEYGAMTEDMGMQSEALEMLERAMSLKPTLGLAALRLGNIYASHNDDARAITFFEKASKARPDSPVPYNNIGLAHMRLGRTQEALDVFHEGLDSTPEGAFGRNMILNNLGLLHKQQGDLDGALQSFQRAMDIDRGSVEAAGNLASTLIDLGSHEQALEICAGMMDAGYHTALLVEIAVAALALLDRIHDAAALIHQAEDASEDAAAQGHNELEPAAILSAAISRLSAAGQPMAAVDLLAVIDVHAPHHFVLAAQLLTEAHQREEERLALRAYATTMRLLHGTGAAAQNHTEVLVPMLQDEARSRPRGSPALQALRGTAMLLYQMTRFADAEAVFRRILRHKDRDPTVDNLALAEVYNGLGASVEMSHTRLDEAVAHYATSLTLKPDFFVPFFSQVHLLGRICDWREWESHFDKVRALIDQGASGGMGPIFALAYPISSIQLCSVTRNRAADVLARANAARSQTPIDLWHAQLWQQGSSAPSAPPHLDKLALAIVSADLNARPVGQLVQGVVERLVRAHGLEVFCFSLEVFDGSEPARRMAEAATEFQFVKGLDSRLLAEMINSVQAHIMIDLNGYTDGGRSELLVLKPAPVTVAYLGYPHTMALNGVDYMIADRVVSPPEHYSSCFSGTPPHPEARTPTPHTRGPRSECGQCCSCVFGAGRVGALIPRGRVADLDCDCRAPRHRSSHVHGHGPPPRTRLEHHWLLLSCRGQRPLVAPYGF
jgi:tetratricopeptide (TPR) repeat protein